jgi:hypothetical protein
MPPISNPEFTDACIPADANNNTAAQPNVDRVSAPRGPNRSKTDPYVNSRTIDTGEMNALANANAPGDPGYPVELDVNNATVIGRANEYPK